MKTARRHAREKHTDISVAERHMAVRRTAVKQNTTEQSGQNINEAKCFVS